MRVAAADGAFVVLYTLPFGERVDDHSRLLVHGRWMTEENTRAGQDVRHEAIARRARPRFCIAIPGTVRQCRPGTPLRGAGHPTVGRPFGFTRTAFSKSIAAWDRPGDGSWYALDGPSAFWGAPGDVSLPLPYAIQRTLGPSI